MICFGRFWLPVFVGRASRQSGVTGCFADISQCSPAFFHAVAQLERFLPGHRPPSTAGLRRRAHSPLLGCLLRDVSVRPGA